MWRHLLLAGTFCVVCLGWGFAAEELELDQADLLLLLKASFAKIRVNGAAGQAFRLELADKTEKRRSSMDLKLGEGGTGILTVMAYNDSGVCGSSKTVDLYVRWQTDPADTVVQLHLQKFWKPNVGKIQAGAPLDQTFSNERGTWNMAKEERYGLCTVRRHPNAGASKAEVYLEGETIASIFLVTVVKE